MLDSLASIARKPVRRVIGLMSGTSMDGVDAALVRLSGGGAHLQAKLESYRCRPYEPELRHRLLQAASSVPLVALEHGRLEFDVARAFAAATQQLLAQASVAPADVDLIGSHGQTLAHHAPGGGAAGATTWQAGAANVLAALTGIPVVSDFRTADIALGGTGAPLVPLADWLLRRSEHESRLLLNIGGIANFTHLRARCRRDEVLGWDVGPGNVLLDGLAQRLLQRDYDRDGEEACRGRADAEWVEAQLAREFFRRQPPKSAGREEFGAEILESLLRHGQGRKLTPADLLATAVELTARGIALARQQEPLARLPLDAVYVCGGGRHNGALMRRLQALLAPARVQGFEALGLAAEAKEAVDFAVLAHESVLGHAGNLTGITAARRPCILGSLALAAFAPSEDS